MNRSIHASIAAVAALLLALPAQAGDNPSDYAVGSASSPASGGNATPNPTANDSGKKSDGGGGDGDRGSVISSVRMAGTSGASKEWHGLDMPHQKLYRGVIPNVRNTTTQFDGARRRASKSKFDRLTWLGFQSLEDKTRVFIQTTRTPSYRVERGETEGELVVVLQDTLPSFTNFARPIDTRFFPRSVAYIWSRRGKKGRSKEVRVSIQLRRKVEFQVTSAGNYVYVDLQDAHLEPSKKAEKKSEAKKKTVYDDPS